MNGGGDSVFLAVDLGAGSGRVIAGVFDGGGLVLEEVARFGNKPIEAAGGLFWDFARLWSDVVAGLRAGAERFGPERVRSVAVDTWGVDYGLVDGAGNLAAPPRHYRDPRTRGAMDEVFRRVPKSRVFAKTGIQFMPINTLYQFRAEARDSPGNFERARQFLMVPDLINLRLTGRAVCERTNASTTQCYNPVAGTWEPELLEAAGVPPRLVPPLVDPGTVLGTLLGEVAAATGLNPATPVVAVGSHDTASAVAAVPAEPGSRFAYLSSGTWSLLGAEVRQPLLDQRCLEYNFTNEIGVGGTVRLLKNICGMWLVQECSRTWAERGAELGAAEMARQAAVSDPWVSFVDPDDPAFAAPGNMPDRIAGFCQRSGQEVPHSRGALLRVITDSLALKYRFVLGRLEELVGHGIEVIHLIGGGGQHRLLNQCVADCTGRPVVVGPFEATAAGNILIQMVATGAVASLDDGRSLVARSLGTERFEPADTGSWDQAYERFLPLVK